MPTVVHVEPVLVEEWQTVSVKMSWYNPALGGPNCLTFVNGKCISRMASGERWQDWLGRAVACPPSWPFWTKIRLPGGEEFFCLDRGSAIVYGADGLPFIDLLVEYPPVPFGTVLEIGVQFP